MKKRNKPYLLITFLVVLGAVAFGFNYISTMSGGPGNSPVEAPKQVLGETRGKETKADVASSVKASLGAKSTGPEAGAMPPQAREAMTPSLVSKPKASSYKPQPSDSNISTQWYNHESLNGNK